MVEVLNFVFESPLHYFGVLIIVWSFNLVHIGIENNANPPDSDGD